MNRKNKKNNSTLGIGIIAVVALMNVLSAADGGAFVGILAAVLILGAVGFAVAFTLAKKQGMAKKGSVYHAERAKEKAKHIFMREEYGEEAVKCAHPRGREKYIHQLDNFLATGIIDKSEYRVLKARYEKMNIPENMH